MLERVLRGIDGVFVLLSLSLGYFVSSWWYLFTALVGFNLFKSAFTNWCLMMTFLYWGGLRSCPDIHVKQEAN